MRRWQLLTLLLTVPWLAAADPPAPIALPSVDQLANASPSVLLALGVFGLVTGWLVPKYVNQAAEKRATDATAAAAIAVQTAKDAVAAVANLSSDHAKETAAFRESIDKMVGELSDMRAALARGSGRR
jgi:soluble cytochrome b562